MKIDIASENALIITFSKEVSEQTSAAVYQATHALETMLGKGIIDLIPSYASLLVVYDDAMYDIYSIRQVIYQTLMTNSQNQARSASRVVTLPVYYGAEAAPDLAELAANANLSVQEVIDIHQGMQYQVFAIGFAPGFAFLGEVDPRIAAPRKTTPRKAVPKGAVAIADRQTAVYPTESPGGWNLIGLCPTSMFDANSTPNMPVEVGDTVIFKAIERDAFLALGGVL